MKRFGIFGICVLMTVIYCYHLESTFNEVPYHTIANAPTLAEYNQKRYEKYLGEPVQAIVITEEDYPEFTPEEIDLMAQIVMNESEAEPIEGKQAVAQVIINRLKSSKFPDNLEDVIYQEDQFATSGTKKPTLDCYDAVYAAIEYEDFPANMFYFRNKHYHNFGVSYCQIGNHYFSTED